MSLTNCPTDILIHIFRLLDEYQIVTCKEVCHRFASTIETDVEIQYKLQLLQSQTVDRSDSNSHISVGERLRGLQSMITARHKLWTQPEFEIARVDISSWLHNPRAAWGYSSELFVVDETGSVRCVDVMSTDPTSTRTWRYNTDPLPPWSVSFSRKENLFVWAATSHQNGIWNTDIRLVDLMSGSPHPKAIIPLIVDDLGESNGYEIQIYKDIISVDTRLRGGIVVGLYNWKTGGLIDKRGIYNPTFIFQTILDEEHIIICTYRAEVGKIELRIYWMETFYLLCVLEFHPVREFDVIANLKGHFSNGLTRLNPPDHLPFSTSPDTSIIALSLSDLLSRWSLVCVVPYSFIKSQLDSLSKYDPSFTAKIIPWGQWPNCTFAPRTGEPTISAYGHRLAVGHPNMKEVSVYEFDVGFFKKPMSNVLKAESTYGKHPWRSATPTTILTQTLPTMFSEFKLENAVSGKVVLEEDVLGIGMDDGRFHVFRVPFSGDQDAARKD